jgi:hypothetical protein
MQTDISPLELAIRPQCKFARRVDKAPSGLGAEEMVKATMSKDWRWKKRSHVSSTKQRSIAFCPGLFSYHCKYRLCLRALLPA